MAATAEDFYRAIVAGDEEMCRQILLDRHLSGERVGRIFDTVVAPAFHFLGTGWECDGVQIYQERRGSGICLRTLEELKALIPEPQATAPLAIGATPECDPYMLPTFMVAVVLRQAHWRSQSLGSRIPFDSLLAAIEKMKPQLFWLSVSHIDDEQRFLADYRQFYEVAQAMPLLSSAAAPSLSRFVERCDTQHIATTCNTSRLWSKPSVVRSQPARCHRAIVEHG